MDYASPRTHEGALQRGLGRAELALTEGLWDCESDVRLIAAQHTPLSETTRARLRYLRDDKIETPGVRAAATTRLAGATAE